jgi:endonuclease/exonuclease/phosphatase (EEP) superfamily protein YafD
MTTPAPRGLTRLRAALVLASLAPALVLAVSLTDPWWPGQLCVNWCAQAAFLLLPALVAFGRRPLVGGAILALMGIGLWPLWLAANEPRLSAPGAGQPSLRLACGNVAAKSPWHRAAVRALSAQDADLLVMVEVDDQDRQALKDDARWPHQWWTSGIAVLSRYPLAGRSTPHWDMLSCVVQWPSCPELRVIAIHTLKPMRPAWQRVRDHALADLTLELHGSPGPTVVLGDFNLTPADAVWRRLHAESGLSRPAAESATWPCALLGAGIAIDHILGRGVALTPTRAVWIWGSDHRGLAAELAPAQ